MTDPITVSIMIILGKYALDKGAELAKEAGPAAAEKAGELFKKALNYLRKEPKGQVLADGYAQDPDTYEKPVEKELEEAVQADPAFAAELKELLAQFAAAAEAHAGPSYTATLIGDGAIALGSGDALGKGAVKAENVSGPIITGSGHTIHTGPSPASAAALPPALAPLRDKLTQYFNKSELKALCFDLGVAHDDLPSETRTELAQALVEYCHQRGRLPELKERCRVERPKVDWS